uniref:putative methyltransferase-like protein 21E n=1 Tax=Pristiophorus japonicus TaxID=55135 RepID=UPI00398EFDC0
MNNTEKTSIEKEMTEDEQISSEIMKRRWVPNVFKSTSWEGFQFAGYEIKITEATDCYGAYVWPSALVLCYYLEHSQKENSLNDKNVIEIGSGTGLVSIVAGILGSYVTATDLPHLLGNLEYNISRNTKMRSFAPEHREWRRSGLPYPVAILRSGFAAALSSIAGKSCAGCGTPLVATSAENELMLATKYSESRLSHIAEELNCRGVKQPIISSNYINRFPGISYGVSTQRHT